MAGLQRLEVSRASLRPRDPYHQVPEDSMRTARPWALVALALAATACNEGETVVVPVLEYESALSVAANGAKNEAVALSGREEVPERPTHARGSAIFHLSEDGTTMSYKLIVANIENVIASHIHLGEAGANGPVVVFLFGPAAPRGGGTNGVISEGSFTSADFINDLAGME